MRAERSWSYAYTNTVLEDIRWFRFLVAFPQSYCEQRDAHESPLAEGTMII
jgi:hypothetical protein